MRRLTILLCFYLIVLCSNAQKSNVEQRSLLQADIDSLKELNANLKDDITDIESMLKKKYLGALLVTKDNVEKVKKIKDSILNNEETASAPTRANVESIKTAEIDVNDQNQLIGEYKRDISVYKNLQIKISALQDTVDTYREKLKKASAKISPATSPTNDFEKSPNWDSLYSEFARTRINVQLNYIDSLLRYTHKEEYAFIKNILNASNPSISDVKYAWNKITVIWTDYGLSSSDGILFMESQKIQNLLNYLDFKDYAENVFFSKKYSFANRLEAAKKSALIVARKPWLQDKLINDYNDLVDVSAMYCGFTINMVDFLKKLNTSGMPRDINTLFNLPDLSGIDYYPFLKNQVKKYFIPNRISESFFLEVSIAQCGD